MHNEVHYVVSISNFDVYVLSGLKCGECISGSYNLNAENPDGCTMCECDTNGSVNSSCNVVTGQCYCKPNVMGLKCDICTPGFYALNKNDLDQNGCSQPCDCNPAGTLSHKSGICERFGGNCSCKQHVMGRQCDQCIVDTYGFNQSTEFGCLTCGCDIRGTVMSGGPCDVVTGQCPCKINVEARSCDMCKSNTFGLQEVNPNGCGQCDCYWFGVVQNEACGILEGKCPCIEGAGDPSISNYSCVSTVILYFIIIIIK